MQKSCHKRAWLIELQRLHPLWCLVPSLRQSNSYTQLLPQRQMRSRFISPGQAKPSGESPGCRSAPLVPLRAQQQEQARRPSTQAAKL